MKKRKQVRPIHFYFNTFDIIARQISDDLYNRLEWNIAQKINTQLYENLEYNLYCNLDKQTVRDLYEY